MKNRKDLTYYPTITKYKDVSLQVQVYLETETFTIGRVNTTEEAEELYNKWFLENYEKYKPKLPKGIYYIDRPKINYKGFSFLIYYKNKQIFTKTSKNIIELVELRKAIIKSLIADII